MRDCYLPNSAKIIARTQDAPDIFSLTLALTDQVQQATYHFAPGQFNMLYCYGVGEVPISIVSDPEDEHLMVHTIRRLGRVTGVLSLLKVGDEVGIRGPFGRGWPLSLATHKDILIITGGLGCAPSVSVIHYIMKRRHEFGKVTIMQGVKHSDDLIYRQQYAAWANIPNTEVLLAADVVKPNWPGYSGLIIDLLDKIELNHANTLCMMCGPEAMMCAAIAKLCHQGFPKDRIYLSLERNMECAVGHCGHCQFGGEFICKNGPVFCYPEVSALLGKKGF